MYWQKKGWWPDNVSVTRTLQWLPMLKIQLLATQICSYCYLLLIQLDFAGNPNPFSDHRYMIHLFLKTIAIKALVVGRVQLNSLFNQYLTVLFSSRSRDSLTSRLLCNIRFRWCKKKSKFLQTAFLKSSKTSRTQEKLGFFYQHAIKPGILPIPSTKQSH